MFVYEGNMYDNFHTELYWLELVSNIDFNVTLDLPVGTASWTIQFAVICVVLNQQFEHVNIVLKLCIKLTCNGS